MLSFPAFHILLKISDQAEVRREVRQWRWNQKAGGEEEEQDETRSCGPRGGAAERRREEAQ